MSSAAEDRSRITPEEYYRIERDAAEKSDWYDGEMFNMAGGTTNHSRIKMNLSGLLHAQLKGKPCEPLDSDQRLLIQTTGLRTYPDATIYCGPIEYDTEDPVKETATNPTVIFAVLSDSTEAYDRGLKAESYRRLPSLQSYLLISQHHAHIEQFERQPDGSWRFHEVKGLDAEMRIPSVKVTLPLADLYDRVEFPGGGD
ncbi:MAG: Uma2 family endonuclease [Verrucomicrobiae bacterium]|nr:Uma2 family endonuclease [Verrucomicrobiae bacterium]